MSKPVILTGLRANNDLQIGNYFGALMPIIAMANQHAGDYQVNLFVPDLHSFTTPIDHSQLQVQIMNNLKIFVAAGLPLDNPDVHLYRQSYVPAHSELAWILDCFTGFGELSRMTEFKDKSARLGVEHIGVGQFNYPALMAADILLYDTAYVPVGDDQRQHIEFTRMIAERMNKRFGDVFTLPASMKEQAVFFGSKAALRIMDLADPLKKMSKSDESGKGIIYLGDSPEAAHKKVMGATTDAVGAINYDPAQQPGISNLLDILALLRGVDVQTAAAEYTGQTSYGSFKTVVADEVAAFLTKFQTQLGQVDEQAIQAKLATSEQAMNDAANQTLLRVQKAIGLR
ncbi:MAG: tryptophan--tRNA ligase [Candidatus Saccharimonadales bacterium]